ncbi:hypothetical protein PoB_005714500 [Plakobranchus ocellatus]|uniref:Uncharacterized protein n=1 Tax=Plakobranchus ocellatus TaxID=259542 RepID=A0AAV4CD10_9GAST|nr:hypothetical protein PoB_005714500 [Plakobranchus ocellatus]
MLQVSSPKLLESNSSPKALFRVPAKQSHLSARFAAEGEAEPLNTQQTRFDLTFPRILPSLTLVIQSDTPCCFQPKNGFGKGRKHFQALRWKGSCSVSPLSDDVNHMMNEK